MARVIALDSIAPRPFAYPPATLVLDPKAVGADLKVVDDDGRRTFTARILRRPWPEAGQRVGFATAHTTFVGVVTRTELEQDYPGRERWVMTVAGRVEQFDCRGLLDDEGGGG